VRFTLRGEADGLVKALAEEHTKRVAAQKKAARRRGPPP
jgi:hypothetical protein